MGPIFTSESPDCTYMFTWPTPLACPYTPVLDCGAHLASGQYVDLSSLSVSDSATAVSAGSSTYYINVCSRVVHHGCPSVAGACLVNADGSAMSLGKYAHQSPAASGTVVDLLYVDGDACPENVEKTAQTSITFVCGVDAPPRLTRTYMGATHCHYEFEWATCQVCPDTSCSNTPATTTPTITPTTAQAVHAGSAGSGGSSHGAVIAVVVVLVVVVAALVGFVLYSPTRRARVLSFFSRKKGGPTYQYSKVSAEGGSATSLFGTGDDDEDDADDDALMPL